MWKWTCPSGAHFQYGEYHSYQGALFFLNAHINGLKDMHVKPCLLEHRIFDDFKPCSYLGCELQYIPFRAFFK
jgi:hypothetical protein